MIQGGDVAGNNDQEIAASIRGVEDNVDFNDEGGKGVDNEFNNLCDKDDTYDEPRLFDTTVRQQEADDDDDDNVVGDWNLDDDLVVGVVLPVTMIKR